MPEVTINAADLEALLFAAGAANASPDAKKILKRDDQFAQVEGRLTDAIKRAGDSWRMANRAHAHPDRFEVSEYEINYLVGLARRGAASRFGMVEPLHDQIDRSYISKMLLEYGIYAETVTWSTSGQQDQMTHAPRRVRLTTEGRAIVEKHARDAMATPDPALSRGIYGTHDFSAGDNCPNCKAPRLHVEDGLIGPKCAGIVIIKPRVHEADTTGTALDLSESFPNSLPTHWPIAGRSDEG